MSTKILSFARRASFISMLLLSMSPAQAGDPVKVKASRCQLEPKERTLSAFVLSGTPGIVTALHGVADCSDILVTQGDRGISFVVTVARVSVPHDLALLAPRDWKDDESLRQIRAFEPMFEGEPVWPDDAVTAIGYPHGMWQPQENDQLRMGKPIMARLGDIIGEDQLELIGRKSPDISVQVFKVTGLIEKGESGSPLMVRHANGRVIGVVIGSVDPGRSKIGWVMPLRNVDWKFPTTYPWTGSRLPNSLSSAVELKQQGETHEYFVVLSNAGREIFRFSVTVASDGELEKIVPARGTWQRVTIRDYATNALVAEANVGEPLKFVDSRGGNHDVQVSNIGGSVAIGFVNRRPSPPMNLQVQ